MRLTFHNKITWYTLYKRPEGTNIDQSISGGWPILEVTWVTWSFKKKSHKLYVLTLCHTYLRHPFHLICSKHTNTCMRKEGGREEDWNYTQPRHLKILVIQTVKIIEVPCTSLTRNSCINSVKVFLQKKNTTALGNENYWNVKKKENVEVH